MPTFSFGDLRRHPARHERAPAMYGHGHTWRVEAIDLQRAILAFRVKCLFPHEFSTTRVATESCDQHGVPKKIYLSSGPGAEVIVYVNGEQEIARIPVEDPAAEYIPGRLPAALVGAVEAVSSSTALARAGDDTGLCNLTRQGLAERQLELTRMRAELAAQQQALAARVAALEAETKRRYEQMWVIELYIGSNERVTVLRTGQPAPAHERITVRQRVLCMDEEIVVNEWLDHPERIGAFGIQRLEDFDRWLVESPGALDSICPWPKGIVGLRVRRRDMKRAPAANLATAWANSLEDEANQSTYLLVRNGEQLYRLWIDVVLWPRMFPAIEDVDTRDRFDWRDEVRHKMTHDEAAARQKQQAAGLIAVAGLLHRSELLHPLPHPEINPFNEDHVDEYFNLVRDDEGTVKLLGDGREFEHLTWNGYRKWIQAQIHPGMRVVYVPDRWHGNLDERVASHNVFSWPSEDKIYILQEVENASCFDYSFLYNPGDTVYTRNYDDEHTRKRRIRFGCAVSEVIPVDFVSWRVLAHFMQDRGQRQEYEDLFTVAAHWYKVVRREAGREQPFIDLVLTQAGASLADTRERARAERLLRWWKVKTREHRSLGADEAKALRMIVNEFRRGTDVENDPEYLLMKEK